jgi:hypothetical protein
LIRVAGAALLAAVLAGCGSASESSLDRSADATSADTSRFELRFQVTGEPLKADEFKFEISGLFDYPNERGLMTMEAAGSPDEEMPVEFRLIGKTGYERWIVKGKNYWVKEIEPEPSGDPTELLMPFPGSQTKPTDVLTRVLHASDKVETVGKEDVRGVETTRYRANVNTRELVKQLPADKRPTEDVMSEDLPVEIWIDAESRLRRLRFTEDLSETDEPASFHMEIDLFDYGVEVDVQPPPADELISQDELDRLQGQGVETQVESGRLEPMDPEEVCKSAREHLPKKDADQVCADVKAKGASGEGRPVSPDKVCEAPREDRTKADRFCLEMKEKQ